MNTPFSLVPRNLWHHCSLAEGRIWVVLRGFANSETDIAWSSKATIAEEANCTPARVRTSIIGLIKCGLLIEVDHPYSHSSIKAYKVLLPKDGSHQIENDTHTENDIDQKRLKPLSKTIIEGYRKRSNTQTKTIEYPIENDRIPDRKRDPIIRRTEEEHKNYQKKESEELSIGDLFDSGLDQTTPAPKKKSQPKADPRIQELWDHWRKVYPKTRLKSWKSEKKHLEALKTALEVYTLTELKKAISGLPEFLQKDEFWQSRPPEFKLVFMESGSFSENRVDECIEYGNRAAVGDIRSMLDIERIRQYHEARTHSGETKLFQGLEVKMGEVEINGKIRKVPDVGFIDFIEVILLSDLKTDHPEWEKEIKSEIEIRKHNFREAIEHRKQSIKNAQKHDLEEIQEEIPFELEVNQ